MRPTQNADDRIELWDFIAELEATEKVYHMNREWIAKAKDEIAKLLIIAESQTKLITKYGDALKWIAGIDVSKPYCTYYERADGNGNIVPTTSEVALKALEEE